MEQINTAVIAEQNQFMSTYYMLKKLVEVCPDTIWQERYYEVPFWYQVYHCVFFIDYWFREDYEVPFVPLSNAGEGIPPEFETEIPFDAFISREDMNTYLERLEKKVQLFFENMSDQDLGKSITFGRDHLTYADVIACQNRHVMYNIGYLNGILRSMDLEESDWWAYNETD